MVLLVYAALALGRVRAGSSMPVDASAWLPLRQAVATCLAFTFLNPHVYLDMVVLLGSLSSRYEGAARLACGAGAGTASFVWFFALGYGARVLQPMFARPAAWRVLDGLIAVVMVAVALGLAERLLSGG